MFDLCGVPADEFPQEVFDILQDGQMTPNLQDDEVEGIYMTVMYSAGYISVCLQYLQL